MAKISKANFRDLSEKKTVFIEFLEIIQNKMGCSSKLLRIKFSEVIFIPCRPRGFISDRSTDQV